jgi:beta-lactamase superfamily II metal-dependent hydrolase
MLRLHVIQALYGDTLILEYGTPANRRYTLVDGGPKTIYEDHLRPMLLDISSRGGKLDLVVLSHVDEDHVYGLLELMSDLRHQQQSASPKTIDIDALWHNSFSGTIGRDLQNRFRQMMAAIPRSGEKKMVSDRANRSINQGDRLHTMAKGLGIDLNPHFGEERLITVEGSPQGVDVGNLNLRIVGPTQKNLRRLRKQWLKWLKDQEKRVRDPDPAAAERALREADTSVPNLSSIMFLARADERTILFTGDGRGDHLLIGLDQAGLLDCEGKLHVDVLKLPHHGSMNNVSEEFFQAVAADHYVVSADGVKHPHPSLETLVWIVQSAKERGRAIKIHVTNETEATRELEAQYDPDEYGYQLVKLEPGAHALPPLELA